ncbi:MAG: hypothetical protein ACHQ1D_09175 [Nitrososphaerales archaeon]
MDLKITGYRFHLFAFAICTISWTTQRGKSECELLPDGKYRLEYTLNSTEKPSIISISNDKFSQCCSLGDTLKGKITWIYDCCLTLTVNGRLLDTSNNLNNMLRRSFGEHCLELKKATGDSIFFRTTYTGNLHITINEGHFIRLK